MRKKIVIVILILIFNFVLLYSQKIVKTNLVEPNTLDPQDSWSVSSLNYSYNIFDTLLKYKKRTYKLMPSLATKWKMLNGGYKYILTLRRGVKFHNGENFDADSVIFTFKRGLSKEKGKPRFPIFYEMYKYIKSVERAGKYKVVFKLKKPIVTFLYSLTSIQTAIISPTAVKKYKEKFDFHPIGTGPFVFKRWEKGVKIELSANKNYWRGKPRIDTFISIFPHNFGDNQYNPLFLIQNNKIDFTNRYSISKMVSLKQIKWIKIAKIPLWGTEFLMFNLSKKPFDNIYFRKAMNYLWNKRTLKYIFQEYIIPTDSLLPRNVPGYDEKNIEKYPFSIKKAKMMIKKAGIKKRLKIEYSTVNLTNDLSYDMMLRYKKVLKTVGIDMDIKIYSMKEFDKKIANNDFDIILSGIIADYPEMYSFLAPLFLAKSVNLGAPTFERYMKVDRIRKMLKTASIEVSDLKRAEIYRNINSIVSKEALIVPVMQVMDLIIYRDNIKGLSEDFVGVIDLYNLRINEN
jgi:ABC-type transport system substrate-binding protein